MYLESGERRRRAHQTVLGQGGKKRERHNFSGHSSADERLQNVGLMNRLAKIRVVTLIGAVTVNRFAGVGVIVRKAEIEYTAQLIDRRWVAFLQRQPVLLVRQPHQRPDVPEFLSGS